MLHPFEARVHQNEGDVGQLCKRVDTDTIQAKKYFLCNRPLHGRYLEVKPTDKDGTILACHLEVEGREKASEHFVPYYFHFVFNLSCEVHTKNREKF